MLIVALERIQKKRDLFIELYLLYYYILLFLEYLTSLLNKRKYIMRKKLNLNIYFLLIFYQFMPFFFTTNK